MIEHDPQLGNLGLEIAVMPLLDVKPEQAAPGDPVINFFRHEVVSLYVDGELCAQRVASPARTVELNQLSGTIPEALVDAAIANVVEERNSEKTLHVPVMFMMAASGAGAAALACNEVIHNGSNLVKVACGIGVVIGSLISAGSVTSGVKMIKNESIITQKPTRVIGALQSFKASRT